MKQVMMIKFDSPKWRMIDEYKVANPFIEVGFRQVKDVVDLRVFDLLNISRINNNRAEEMLLCIYHLLQPDRRIDEGIYNDEIDQYFSYRVKFASYKSKKISQLVSRGQKNEQIGA